MPAPARVLGVGIATLDIISLVDHYPAEDEELRALEQYRARGGNATNTLVVLARLGHHCEWAGMLPLEPDGEFVRQDLERHGIGLGHVLRLRDGKLPLSCITLNRATGSRTIVHYRDLPEYPASAFEAIDLSRCDWVHFEGRAVEALGPMLQQASGSPARVSLEVEKPRAGIEALFSLPDLLLFSRHYAESRGYREPERFLKEALPGDREAWLAWGSAGAWLKEADGRCHFHPAPRVKAVDSIGAGDTFNAAVIDGHLRGLDPCRTLDRAVRLAAAKVGRRGFDGLETVLNG